MNTFFDDYTGVVTLCGSTKFYDEAVECNKVLTCKGWVVLMSGLWLHSIHKDFDISPIDLEKVKQLHLKKIYMSDAVVVVSGKSGYIGDSTKREIEFTKKFHIPIFYYREGKFSGNTNIHPLYLTSLKIKEGYTEQGIEDVQSFELQDEYLF